MGKGFGNSTLSYESELSLLISHRLSTQPGKPILLHMFIGPKIYSEVRKERDGVEVRALQYNNDHEEYTKEEFDYRGNIQYSTMINKISAFPLRRMYIVRVLQDLISENNNKQIMVLSHKRDLLDYLEGEISRIEFATCGQYVGGMKQTALQTSETKQIVLATYAMAAEALDIKTLNTLVMVSPKTDIRIF